MGDIQRIGQNTYYLAQGEAVISFKGANLADDFDIGKVKEVQAPGSGDPIKIKTWGKLNDLPQQRELLVSSNNIVPALLERKRNILVGQGVYAFTSRYEKNAAGQLDRIDEEVEMPPQIRAWLDGEGWANNSNFDEYLAAAAGEFVKHSLIITEFIRTAEVKLGNKAAIASIDVKECSFMRAGMKNTSGKVDTWYWSGHWLKTSNQQNALEPKKTVALPVYAGEDAMQPKFITPKGDFILNDGYYPIPAWWGGWEWIELANQIPVFHKNNLQNGYNIRWHIEMPADYFLDYQKYQDASTSGLAADMEEVLKDQRAKEQAFMDDINQFLATVSNAGRTVFTKYEIDKSLGKDYPGIKITPLNYDMKDEALLKLFERSNTANTSAQGIHPSLAGIETQGKLSSGTEIRNAFLMWLIINAPMPRKLMLAPLKLVQRINGWDPNLNFAIHDYELTSLATDPSGMQQSENAPA